MDQFWGYGDGSAARSSRAVFNPMNPMASALQGAFLCRPRRPATKPGTAEPILRPQPGGSDRPSAPSAPVVLVHGYGGAKSQWFLVERALLRAGFSTVRTMEYDALSSDIPALAERLCRLVRSLADETGASSVHLVGHSLGGVIIRYAVTLAGLDPLVGAAVTVASPHGGSDWARAGTGATAAQLRPGSAVLRHLESAARAGRARWSAFYSDLDLVVSPSRARIRPTALEARNVLIPGEGHLTILLSARLARSLVEHLTDVERGGAGGAGGADADSFGRADERPGHLARLPEAA